ncbi:MAG: putative DNA binding domain-containing protein [Chlamydiales bacterium]|nr:putative DNA binding domain-containing protein [Chlamydiales bacterium]
MKYPESESQTLEFKKEIPKNEQIIKTVIGFCNQVGGRLIIGVENDGTIVGIDENETMQIMECLEHSIYQAATPTIIPKVIAQRIGDKIILEIKVSAGMNKPYFIKSEGPDRGTYIRVGRSVLRANADMIDELRWQTRGISFDGMPVYRATKEDLNLEKINQFFGERLNQATGPMIEEIFKNYELITEEQTIIYPTVCGILHFSKRLEQWFPEAMIICTHFAGTAGREAIATRDCKGTLFEQFAGAYEFGLSCLNRSFTIQGATRNEKYELPEIAYRELLLNAIVHRNYHLRAPIKVSIYQDRIEIFSPGEFPTPFASLKLGLTDIRNMAICKIFREARFVEKLGTGLLTAYNAYEKWGLPEPVIINGENFVKCILPRANYATEQISHKYGQFLQLFTSADSISVSEIMQALHIPRATATRRLTQLVKEGMLKKSGRGKATRYHKIDS